jgi:hypothetical protein
VDSPFDHDRPDADTSPHPAYAVAASADVDHRARALSVADLREASVSRLLTMRVQRHPAARLVERRGEAAVIELHCGALCGLRLTTPEIRLFRKLAEPHDLFGALTDCGGTADYSSVFHRLVQLGAIVEVGSPMA